MGLGVLGLDLTILLALVPERVLGVRREEVDLDLVVQYIVRHSVLPMPNRNARKRNRGDVSVQIDELPNFCRSSIRLWIN